MEPSVASFGGKDVPVGASLLLGAAGEVVGESSSFSGVGEALAGASLVSGFTEGLGEASVGTPFSSAYSLRLMELRLNSLPMLVAMMTMAARATTIFMILSLSIERIPFCIFA